MRPLTLILCLAHVVSTLHVPSYSCSKTPSLGVGGHCVYHHALCHDFGSNVVVIDNSKEHGDPIKEYESCGRDPDDETFRPHLCFARVGDVDGLPFQSFLHGTWASSRVLEGDNIRWLKGRTLLPGLDGAAGNIVHFAMNVIPGWSYLRHNPSYTFDNVVWNYPAEWVQDFKEWQTNVSETALGTAQRFLALEDLDVIRGNGTLVCFEEAVVTGADNAVFQGPEDAEVFRRQVGARHNISLTRAGLAAALLHAQLHGVAPAGITFVTRPQDRPIRNEPELLLAIATATGREVTVADFGRLSFREQLQVMGRTAVLIGRHGAGLVNVIFMPASTALVEISAPGCQHNAFPPIAMASGHFHYHYVAEATTAVFDPVALQHGMDRWSSAACLSTVCANFCRDISIEVNVEHVVKIVTMAVDATLAFYGSAGSADGYERTPMAPMGFVLDDDDRFRR